MIREVRFDIPISGTLKVSYEGEVTIVVDRAETTVSLESAIPFIKRTILEEGKTIGQVILETAKEIVREKGENRFTAPELYRAALRKYPDIKRASFWSRVVASTPDHPSYKHHRSGADYLSRIDPGVYRLNEPYVGDSTPT